MKFCSVLLFLFVTPFALVMTDQVWSKLKVEGFPSQSPFGVMETFQDFRCAQFAAKQPRCKLFCFDSSSQECTFYSQPPLTSEYACLYDISTCQLSSTTCYKKAPPPDAFICDGIQEEKSYFGTIQATNIYDVMMSCSWQWLVPSGHVIIFTFSSLDLTNCGCACASLQIRDFDTSTLIGSHQYCGSPVPSSIVVLSKMVEIAFETDGSRTLPGFQLQFQILEVYVCDPAITDYTAETGEIEAKTVLEISMTCTWKLIMPAGKLLKITFLDFDLGSCCACAYITLSDASTTQVLTGQTLCGSTTPAIVEASSSNNVDVILTTDGTSRLPGFKLQYETLVESRIFTCTGSQVITETSGIVKIVSSGKYSNDMSCTWNLQMPAASRLWLYFSMFVIEDCCDSVRLTDVASSTLLGGQEFSGVSIPPAMTSTGNEVQVTFTSDGSVVYPGFHLHYRAI